jgi:hypothetical protein
MADMVNHGVSGGFSGLIYYSDTTALYQIYKGDIWDMIYDDACANGMSVFELIGHSNLAKNASTIDQVENFMVWYAAEKVAMDLTQGKYWQRDRRVRRI